MFSKGHDFFKPAESSTEVTSDRNYSRLPRELYALGTRTEGTPPSILRPRDAACHLIPEVPGRPHSDYINGNRIINMDLLGNMLSSIYVMHHHQSSACHTPQFRFPCAAEKTQGLGTSVVVECGHCNFVSSNNVLYKKLCTGKTGKPAAEINVRLGQYMASNSTSISSVQCLFAILDTKVPCGKTIGRNISKASTCQEVLGENQLEKNRMAVNEISDHLENDKNNPVCVIAACDTMYNNPSKGGNMQPGTQSSTPFVEMNTAKQLIIGMETNSQICSKRKPGKLICNNHDGCTANYKVGGSMSNVEKIAAASFHEKIKAGCLRGKLSHFLTDGCNQAMSGINDRGIERLLCTQHLKRGQLRKFYSVLPSLSPGIFGKNNPAGMKKQLGYIIADRCGAELKRARLRHRDDSSFFAAMERCRKFILLCISGIHVKCPSSSYTCKRGNKNFVCTNQAPKQFLLSLQDVNTLQQVVDYRLVSHSEDNVLSYTFCHIQTH